MLETDRIHVLRALAALLTCAVLVAGCRPADPELDPWQETPLEGAASRCDDQEMDELLASMRRRHRSPNLRDLHHPDGALARFVGGCGGGLLNPARSDPDAAVLRTMLELAGHEATVESARAQLAFAHLDRARIALPETRHRGAVPAGAAIVSVTESGLIRLSSGAELSVVIPGPEDVRSFAASVMARAAGAAAAPEASSGGAAALTLEIGPGDEVRIGDERESLPISALAPALAEILPTARGGAASEIALAAERGTSYGHAVAVLDALAGREAATAVTVALARGAELELRLPAAAGTPAFAIKADRSAPFASVVNVLDALARARVERVILLSSLDLEPPAAPLPSTYPGGLPGGLGLGLGLRSVERERPERAARRSEAIPERRVVAERAPSARAARAVPEAAVAPPPRAGGPLMVGGDVRAPVKVYAPPPEYTEIARKARIQGVVIVQAVIDEQGDVVGVKVLKGLPMGLEAKAVEAIEQWRFEPATRAGEPVAVYYNLTVHFLLE